MQSQEILFLVSAAVILIIFSKTITEMEQTSTYMIF